MKNIKDICSSECPNSFIKAARPLTKCAVIPTNKVQEFADNVYENFETFKPNSDILDKDYIVKILQMLRYINVLIKGSLVF